MQAAADGGRAAASSPRSLRGREKERCRCLSWAVMGRLVISPWEGLEMLFGGVLGLSRLGQVSAGQGFDQAASVGPDFVLNLMR